MSAEPETPLLGPTQRLVVGIALTMVALLASAAAIVATFFVLGRLAGFFSGVLWPLAVAGVLAVVLRPLVSFLEQRSRMGRFGAVIVLFVLFLMAAAAFLQWVVPPLVVELIGFFESFGEIWASAIKAIETQHPEMKAFVDRQLANPTVARIVDQVIAESRGMMTAIAPSLRAAGGGVLGFFGFVAQLAIIPVYLFFFLLSEHDPFRNLGNHLTFLREGVRNDVVFLVREFGSIVESFFRGQLIIGLVMGVMMAIGFSLVGLRFGLFAGLLLGVLNIVPYLGTIIGISVVLPLAYLQPGGGFALVGLVVAVMILVQIIEGWFLTPKIMGDRTGLHPVVIIVAIFFWGTAFGGVLGMVLAIPLTAFFVTAWRLMVRKYFPDFAPARRRK